MNLRHFIWIGMFSGMTIGSWIPALWGSGAFSIAGILGGTIGGLLGIYAGNKLANW